MAKLAPIIWEGIQDRCLREGFLKRDKMLYYKESEINGFKDVLCFAMSSYTSFRSVTVYVGIQHILIEKLCRILYQEKLTFYPMILSPNIGHIMPDGKYRDWDFIEGSDFRIQYDSMFEYIHKYGFPFYKKYEDFHLLKEIYDNHHLDFHIATETRFLILPLLCLILGDKEAGIERMNEINSQTGLMRVDFYRLYYENFCKYNENGIILKYGSNES